jgi:acyl-coenzyme A thioesterase PaaI-like protein
MCFGCGRENPIGLQALYYQDDEKVYCTYTPRDEYQGYPGVVHGGILCTILDEVLFRTALIDGDPWMVTARMEVRFKAPVLTEKPLTATAEVTKRKTRVLEAKGEIRLEDGTLAVEANATFVRIPEDSIVNFDEEIEFWEVE